MADRKTLPRCPECRSHPSEYIETVSLGWSFEVEGAVVTDHGATEGIHGPPVTAVCSCGHRWTLRGVHQITDLPLDFDQVEARRETREAAFWERRQRRNTSTEETS